jgi:hypothetical protein
LKPNVFDARTERHGESVAEGQARNPSIREKSQTMKKQFVIALGLAAGVAVALPASAQTGTVMAGSAPGKAGAVETIR